MANSRALKAKVRPERADLRPGRSLGGMDGWMDFFAYLSFLGLL